MRIPLSVLTCLLTLSLLILIGCDPDDGGGKTADAIEDGSADIDITDDAADADDSEGGDATGRVDALDGAGEGDSSEQDTDPGDTVDDISSDTQGSDGDTEADDADGPDSRDLDARDRDGLDPDDVDRAPDTYPYDTDEDLDVGKPLEPGQCTMEQECSGFELCWHPGQLMCGICMGPDMITACSLDVECPADQICNPNPKLCLCSPSGVCTEKCSGQQDCDEGEYCAASGHCKALVCGSSSDCPPNFSCAEIGCLRRPCASTDQCEGYCVKGFCYATAGGCSPPPP